MKIVLEGVESGEDRSIASLHVRCAGDMDARILLPVDAAASDPSAIVERLRDFTDCLVEWTRRGSGLVAPDGEDRDGSQED
jgi:hypothetical protein